MTTTPPAGSENERQARIAEVIAEMRARVASGETVDDGAVIAAHPGLAPELEREIFKWRQVAAAAGYAKAMETAQPGGAEPTTQDSSIYRDERARLEIAGYRFVRLIAQGGQGAVYEAVHLKTGRCVAVKILHAGSLASTAARTRFEREVQMLAILDHPGIVQIMDRGNTADGEFYLTMPYVEGIGLDEWIRTRHAKHASSGAGDVGEPPVITTPDEALTLFMRICDAVNAAHLRGIVHRDLKPSNIRLNREGHAYVLDFGLAKSGLDLAARSGSAQATLTGQFLGSLPWASPEQADGDANRIDTRSDVYSLGVILYQMLTGRLPYEVAGTMREVLNAICTAEPQPPSQVLAAREAKDAQKRAGRVVSELNPSIDAMVLKALHKQREMRYQTAGEFSRDIANYLSGKATLAGGSKSAGSGKPPENSGSRPLRWGVGFGAAAAALMGAWLLWKPAPMLPPTNQGVSVATAAAPVPAPPTKPVTPEPVTPTAGAAPKPVAVPAPALAAVQANPPAPASKALENPPPTPSALYQPPVLEDGSISPFARRVWPWWLRHAPMPGMPDRYFADPLPKITLDHKLFKDPALEKIVRLTIKQFSGEINPANLTTVRYLCADTAGICDLSGIELLTGLKIAQLESNALMDITPLAKLTELQSVRIDGAWVESLRPLAGLKKLVHLSAVNTHVQDLSPLAEIPSLVEVNLSGSWVSDFSPLTKTRVERLDASGTPMASGEFLRKMPQMTQLLLNRVRLDDLKFLNDLPKLSRLEMSGWKLPLSSGTPGRKAVDALRARGVTVELGELPPLTPEQIKAYAEAEAAGLKPGQNYLILDGRMIRDPELEKFIRELIKKPLGLLKPEDLKGLTTLNLAMRGIKDLTGLEHATNLKTLYLQVNEINDLWPVASLHKLTELRIYRNPVANLMWLAGLGKLQSLNAGGTAVTDLQWIVDLPALTDLAINGCKMTDMKPLERAHKLLHLNIDGNPIANLDFLVGMPALEELEASDTEVSNLGFLGSMPKLKNATLLNTRVDLRPDSPASMAIESARARGTNVWPSTREAAKK